MRRTAKLTDLLVVSSALAVLLLLAPGFANATAVSFGLDTMANGGTPPASAITPWLTATIDDGGTPGSVTLTMVALNLGPGEPVEAWNFNLDPSLDPLLLSAGPPTPVSGTFTAPTMSAEADAFPSEGDGTSDIQFEFTTKGGPSAQFAGGEAVSFVITSSEAITADSFSFASVGGVFYSAALLDTNIPAWVGGAATAVPEPSSLALIGIGAIALLAGGWRRRTRLA